MFCPRRLRRGRRRGRLRRPPPPPPRRAPRFRSPPVPNEVKCPIVAPLSISISMLLAFLSNQKPSYFYIHEDSKVVVNSFISLQRHTACIFSIVGMRYLRLSPRPPPHTTFFAYAGNYLLHLTVQWWIVPERCYLTLTDFYCGENLQVGESGVIWPLF